MNERTDDLFPVENINEFANSIMHWHDTRVARIRHMMTIPEGTEVELEEGQSIVLEGSNHQAFRLGLIVALHELGQLPFTAEYETDD